MSVLRYGLLDVNTLDDDLKRRGWALAVMLLSMEVVLLTLSAVNIYNGDFFYLYTNEALMLVVLLIYLTNRMGRVRTASLMTVLISMAVPVLLRDEGALSVYVSMVIPVLIAGSLLAPVAAILVALAMIGLVFWLGIQTLSLVTFALIASFSYLFASSIDSAYRRTLHQALHDSLTGLPNRALLKMRIRHALDRARRDKRLCAVLFVDLDDFKVINDSLGHEAGDELLITLGSRLQEACRPGDTVARLGGDEFAVLLNELPSVEEAVRVAERVIDALVQPVHLQSRSVESDASIGIALSNDLPKSSQDLLRNADLAMYEAKRSGKGKVAVYNAGMYTRSLRRLDLETELRTALEEPEQFVIEYQPQVLLKTGQIVGFEALVRWRHPRWGMVRPDEFISVAEDTGLIVPLGRWVFLQACLQAQAWDDDPRIAVTPAVAVNVSARQFRQPDIVGRVQEHLRVTGVRPGLMEIELTESTVTDEAEDALESLLRMKQVGVKLALDDFGTGYSSLATVRKYPFDTLKIDRSFVQPLGSGNIVTDAQDVAIVELVSNLAHLSGMHSVVEGVETEEQEFLLREIGCDIAQGYYYSKPMSADHATRLLVG